MYTNADQFHRCIKISSSATFFRAFDQRKIESCPVCRPGSFGVSFVWDQLRLVSVLG